MKMAGKQTTAKKKGPVSVEEIEKNIKEIRKSILAIVGNPVYPIRYPNLDDIEGGDINEEVSLNKFMEIYNRMGDAELYYTQADMAAIVINERARIPHDVKHWLNMLSNEINRFKRLIESSKIKEIMKAYEDKR